MWTEVFVSQNKTKTDALLDLLEEKKIMTMLRVSGEDDFGDGTTYSILVPQTELETAQDIIFDAELNRK